MIYQFTALTAAALASFASAAPVEPRVQSCVSGLYMIVARGTYEARGQGKTGEVAKLVAAQVPGSVSVAVDYPASAFGGGPIYPESVTEGIIDTKQKIQDYVDSCGDKSRIVLMGFSQGANVITDTLAGGILKPSPLSAEYGKYIVAVTVFGDPAFAAGQSYDYGSNADGPDEGIFTRLDNKSSMQLLSNYSNVLASYCDQGDRYCASGESSTVHGAVVARHAEEAADFIVSRAS
ncbi:uncharacterized protein LMH87_008372 [Akanthomyces muscarius]|uniref:Acetylxylan esterase n=1 Tax=Akanthomyces muscarius TaxID=2231603 RepID=A0A9W8QIJ9_AKAMU|nr:uncharacterized protein LMH87_008372 [Akanthomyces muscarius]KAJ4159472.1 hypothetical protein LMH87_008372 [Akanthomyces muscarius]